MAAGAAPGWAGGLPPFTLLLLKIAAFPGAYSAACVPGQVFRETNPEIPCPRKLDQFIL